MVRQFCMRVLTVIAILGVSITWTADLFADPAADFFETKIRPILSERCFECHSDATRKNNGGLKLDSKASVQAGGESGPLVVPGNPDESLLMKAVKRRDDSVSAMPPETSLSDAQLRDLDRWIAEGAYFPEGDSPKTEPREHWSFQPVTKPVIPTVKNNAWPRTEPDQFLLAKMEEAGLSPAADASPATVARRLAFVLTGLPPTVDEIDAVNLGGHAAILTYVDQLLESPHFGERWARHWMDLVRYAESGGHEYDYEFEGAWRYRDYLVRAFNCDLPFDQFVKEQVAGDLLPPRVAGGRNEAALGIGWWQLQEQPSSPVDLANDEAERLDNQLDVLGKTFNALTVGCARCHDHIFDPIRTKEYYGLFGIAAASPAIRTWANGPEFDAFADRLIRLRNELIQNPKTSIPVETPPLEIGEAKLLGDFSDGLPAGWALSGYAETVTSQNANELGRPPGLWSGTLSRKLPAYVRSPQMTLEHDHIDLLVAGEDATVQIVVANYQLIRDPIYNGLKRGIKNGEYQWQRFHVGRWKGKRVHVEVFTGTVDGSYRILHTHDTPNSRFGLRAVVLNSGNVLPTPPSVSVDPVSAEFERQAAELERDIPTPERFIGVQDVDGSNVPVFARGDANRPKSDLEPRQYFEVARVHFPAANYGSGRRELAEVLSSPENPLTARVFVNRVWHHVFGRGLVATVDNFGILGESPSHPELLDWLADRFCHEHHWSVKKLIRELVLCRTFGLQGRAPPEVDPINRLLSRAPLRRLEAEAVRDAILVVSGSLDRQLGGESVPVPHQLEGTGSDSGNNYPPSGPIDGDRRRSLYLASRRNFPSVFLDVFDKPSALNTFGRRNVSIVPTQALTLLNDPFVHGQAQVWAQRMSEPDRPVVNRVSQMFREAFARPPTAREIERATSLIGPDESGWEDLAMTLLNAKEFMHVP